MVKNFIAFLVTLGPWGVILLAFIDSAGIPLAVGLDALIMLLAWKNPAQAPLNVSLAVAGSTIGSMVLYFVARKGGEAYWQRHASGEKGRKFQEWFHRFGLLPLFTLTVVPFPTPMKAFVILAGAFAVRPVWVALTIILARTIRYGGEAYLGSQIGAEGSWKWLGVHRWEILGAVAGLFAVLCLVAVALDRRHRSRSAAA